MTPTLALTDGALVGFCTVVVSILATGATLWWQNRDQAKKIGTPNGGGSVAGDVHGVGEEVRKLRSSLDVLHGVVTEHNRMTDRRLDRIERKVDAGSSQSGH